MDCHTMQFKVGLSCLYVNTHDSDSILYTQNWYTVQDSEDSFDRIQQWRLLKKALGLTLTSRLVSAQIVHSRRVIVGHMHVLSATSPVLLSVPQSIHHRSLHYSRFRRVRHLRRASVPDAEDAPSDSSSNADASDSPQDLCLIENRHSVSNFAYLQKEELKGQIESRRNTVFLLLEEIRRLRIQLQLKKRSKGNNKNGSSDEELEYQSVVPIIARSHLLQDKNIKTYIGLYVWGVISVILFGGLVAPSLEVKMGLGGTSYLEFIQSIHLPEQLAEVDPIVASFCGGAVGVLSTLLVIDLNNVKNQQRNRCYYCKGTGYLPCGTCLGSGMSEGDSCGACSSTGKVMCPNCFCTGKHLVTEHDPRIDPFD